MGNAICSYGNCQERRSITYGMDIQETISRILSQVIETLHIQFDTSIKAERIQRKIICNHKNNY